MRTYLVLLTLVAVLSAQADTLVWTNTTGGNWSVAANWSPNQVPGSSDTAVITNAGTYTVTLNASATLAGLQLGGASGTQLLAQAANTLTLNGPGTVAPNGRYNWSGGTLAGAAALVVAPGGQVNLSGSSTKTLSGAVTNGGTVIWSGTGSFSMGAAGVLHNLAAGLVDIQNDEVLDYTSGSPLLVNDGTIRKSAGTVQTQMQVPFINNGTVDAQTGTIRFDTQPKTFNGGCRFTGAGTSLLYSGSSITLNGAIYSENLQLGGAVLTGNGTLSGTMSWTTGNIASNATLTVASDGVLQISGTGALSRYLYGALTNAGQIIWSGTADINLYGVIHNQSGGVFEARNDATLQWVSGAPVFINDGIFRKAQGTGFTYVQVAFINNGTVDAQTGTIRFDTQPKTFNGGCCFTGGGVSSLYSSTAVTLAGAIESENLALNGATVSGAGSVSGSFTWNSGTLTPDVSFNVTSNGLLLLASSGAKTLNGTITNAGTVRWTGAGNLIVRGAIHNLAGGVFDIQNNEVLDWVTGTPVVVNEGTFRKSAGASTTTCQIPFFNRGLVEVNTGTLSFTGTTFTDQAGAITLGSGTFQTAQPLALSGGQLTGMGAVKPGTGLTSASRVAPAGSNGVLTVQGDFTQLLPGALEFELGGTAPGTNHSRLNITGSARLSGSIGVRLAPGYLPNPGDSFQVMTFASHTGDFACFNGFLLLGQNRRLQMSYGTTNLTLVTVTAPDPTNVALTVVAQYPSAVVCWPADFAGYGLYWNSNLATTNWTWLPGVTNRHIETNLAPYKFFRLVK
jgi:fibronectin-binding autotransporter adhesin